jgi:phage gp29-like protein
MFIIYIYIFLNAWVLFVQARFVDAKSALNSSSATHEKPKQHEEILQLQQALVREKSMVRTLQEQIAALTAASCENAMKRSHSHIHGQHRTPHKHEQQQQQNPQSLFAAQETQLQYLEDLLLSTLVQAQPSSSVR